MNLATQSSAEITCGVNYTAPIKMQPNWDEVNTDSGFQVFAKTKLESIHDQPFDVWMVPNGWVGNEQLYETEDIHLFAYVTSVGEFWKLRR